ncbi:MAG: TIGR03943 family protein [Chloroflexota bacterium]
MHPRLYRLFQGLMLIALSLFLAGKLINGNLTWYINLRFVPLTLLGIVLLAVMAQTIFSQSRKKAHEDEDEHTHVSAGNLLILLLPILIGILLPSRPLDSSAVETKGVNVSAPLIAKDRSNEFEAAADERNILDWMRIFNYEEDLSPYLNENARVVGFVYHDDRLPEDQFLLSRFVISCCAADAFAVGIPVQWDGTDALEENTWVEVEGPVQLTEFDGQKAPLVIATGVQTVRAPEQPYLFP